MTTNRAMGLRVVCLAILGVAGCSSGGGSTTGSGGAGGVTASGGSTNQGSGSGGQTAGGSVASGGSVVSGGTVASGGMSGGSVATGGTSASGGVARTGGVLAGGGSQSTGGTSVVGGGPLAGGAVVSGGAVGTGGVSATGGTGTGGTSSTGACTITADMVKVTEIDVGTTVVTNENEYDLKPLVISPIPAGGSRLAFMGNDSKVHVVQLDGTDQVTGAASAFPAYDFGDIYADDKGGALVVSRDATGGGNKNCGTLTNLCGATASLPAQYGCYDMYLIRFDGAAESWATKLTDSSATLPPYSTGPIGADVVFIWWYQHHARIAFDGTNYGAYFGCAISTSEKCVDATSAQATAINIHQGDRLKVVGPTGTVGTGGWGWGCSHSRYQRLAWDATGKRWVPVCLADAYPQPGLNANASALLRSVDYDAGSVGNIVLGGGGYWVTASDKEASAATSADAYLLHYTMSGTTKITATVDKTIPLAATANVNERAVHLAAYGTTRMLAGWESSTKLGTLSRTDTARKFYVQAVDRTSGTVAGTPYAMPVIGNQYQDLVAYPDGSVAFVAPGSAGTKVKIVRVGACP
jgi:hypothetical protein